MDEVEKMENHLSSAAAFVEGGIQDACDDACSICLEAFCDSDPSTVTTCKHEYHLQCILEWCQRSSQCPMCWQPISLKDPTSQELLEAVERERNIRLNQTRSAAIFHHPALGDFELQHLADADFEERIIRHLAAAAAMGRAHHLTRREGPRDRSGSHGRPQFLVFSPHPNAPTIDSVSASSAQRGDNESTPSIVAASPSAPLTLGSESPNQGAHTSSVQSDHSALLTPGTNTIDRAAGSGSRTPAGQSTPVGQDSAGPSDLQSFSETLKSRLNAVSMRYKESFTKSTRGWRERLFSRNSSVTDIGSEVRREVNAGIATVSRMMERLDTRERRTSDTSGSSNTEFQSAVGPSTEAVTRNHEGHSNDTSTSASCVATSGPN